MNDRQNGQQQKQPVPDRWQWTAHGWVQHHTRNRSCRLTISDTCKAYSIQCCLLVQLSGLEGRVKKWIRSWRVCWRKLSSQFWLQQTGNTQLASTHCGDGNQGHCSHTLTSYTANGIEWMTPKSTLPKHYLPFGLAWLITGHRRVSNTLGLHWIQLFPLHNHHHHRRQQQTNQAMWTHLESKKSRYLWVSTQPNVVILHHSCSTHRFN